MIITDKIFEKKLEIYNLSIQAQALRLSTAGRVHGMSIEDLKQAGKVGLWQALRRYDPNFRQKHDRRKKIKEKTYVEYRIWGEMIDQMRKGSLLGHARKKLSEINVFSFTPINEGEESEEDRFGMNLIVDERPSVLDELIIKDKGKLVQRQITQLEKINRDVIELYYYGNYTLKQVGQMLGISEAGACRRSGVAHRQLRKKLFMVKMGEA